MSLNQYLKLIKNRYQLLVFIVAGLLILTLVLSLAQAFKYRSTVQLLVIQKQGSSIDAYTALRSAEKMADNLAAVVYTSSFMEKVSQAPFNLKDNFALDPIKRKKQWQEMISTKVIPETGILKINVYHQERNQAIVYAQAVSWTLVNHGFEYHGGGSEVEIKNIDAALTSRYPVKPNIVLNLAVALAIGLVLALTIVYLLGEERIKEETLADDFSEAAREGLVIPIKVDSPVEPISVEVEEETELENGNNPGSDQTKINREEVGLSSNNLAKDKEKIETMYDHLRYVEVSVRKEI